MQPQFVTIEQKKLLGICLEMSLAENRTIELWRGFLPRLKEIETRIDPKERLVRVQEWLGDKPGKTLKEERIIC